METASHLKFYSEYLMNVEKALAMITKTRSRLSNFDYVLTSIEVSCKDSMNLSTKTTLKHEQGMFYQGRLISLQSIKNNFD